GAVHRELLWPASYRQPGRAADTLHGPKADPGRRRSARTAALALLSDRCRDGPRIRRHSFENRIDRVVELVAFVSNRKTRPDVPRCRVRQALLRSPPHRGMGHLA